MLYGKFTIITNFVILLLQLQIILNQRRIVVILGSTGSIGVNALKIAKQFGMQIEALVCGNNISLLNNQIEQFSPRFIGISSDKYLSKLQARDCEVFVGSKEICNMIHKCQSKHILNSVIGFAGLPFSLETLKLNKKLILANKESLVIAGALIDNVIQKTQEINQIKPLDSLDSKLDKLDEVPNLKATSYSIFPVDSEHFSLWYLLHSNPNQTKPDKLIITASGGALRDMPIHKIKHASLQDVLKHPTWSMGQKITIDSATFVNKLYEIIESYWLFNTTDIDAIIERSSLVHALVEYPNGIISALLSPNDMRIPLAYSMNLEKAKKRFDMQTLKLQDFARICFQEIDINRYPLWAYKDALLATPQLGIVLNAGNEILQNLFLEGKIAFGAFSEVLAQILEHFMKQYLSIKRLEDILELHKEAGKLAYFLLKTNNINKTC
ncbi:1-deoxy-D-xylulose 5-phosphate reductoisomerase [Helicobacter muridarum]|uniref:1-deoxy-D-xylulose 5-phosphate reductoisomerase n=1 Tax=Helicobacter muridarum TaxID=216 RepID=A0A377PSA4_9HELI|nr:1-deoxy-D-xylulose 5-phosphate reductoisomerase [Helicobacter muridarum]